MRASRIIILLLILGVLLAATIPVASAWWWSKDKHKDRAVYDDGHYRIPNYWQHYSEDTKYRNPALPMDKGYYMNMDRQSQEMYYSYLRDVYYARNVNVRQGYN